MASQHLHTFESVPVNKELLTGTVLVNNLFLNFFLFVFMFLFLSICLSPKFQYESPWTFEKEKYICLLILELFHFKFPPTNQLSTDSKVSEYLDDFIETVTLSINRMRESKNC